MIELTAELFSRALLTCIVLGLLLGTAAGIEYEGRCRPAVLKAAVGVLWAVVGTGVTALVGIIWTFNQ